MGLGRQRRRRVGIQGSDTASRHAHSRSTWFVSCSGHRLLHCLHHFFVTIRLGVGIIGFSKVGGLLSLVMVPSLRRYGLHRRRPGARRRFKLDAKLSHQQITDALGLSKGDVLFIYR